MTGFTYSLYFFFGNTSQGYRRCAKLPFFFFFHTNYTLQTSLRVAPIALGSTFKLPVGWFQIVAKLFHLRCGGQS